MTILARIWHPRAQVGPDQHRACPTPNGYPRKITVWGNVLSASHCDPTKQPYVLSASSKGISAMLLVFLYIRDRDGMHGGSRIPSGDYHVIGVNKDASTHIMPCNSTATQIHDNEAERNHLQLRALECARALHTTCLQALT